jgi:hypothetical protein
MKINCLSCGHSLELDESYSDYAGPVRCFICRSFLEIRTRDGKIKSIQVAGRTPLPRKGEPAEVPDAEQG